jgi:hypothetical protein
MTKVIEHQNHCTITIAIIPLLGSDQRPSHTHWSMKQTEPMGFCLLTIMMELLSASSLLLVTV